MHGMNGHYWCDKCDEPAFGSSCQHCHSDARLIPGETSRKPQPHTGRATPVSVEHGHEMFKQIFAAVKP